MVWSIHHAALAELADVDRAALVGADADRARRLALALGHLDVEAELAAVDYLAQGRGDGAARALQGGGHVLDTDFEADGRPALGQALEGKNRRAVLHHPDHRRGREDAGADRSADVGQQMPVDVEVFAAGLARLRARRFRLA